MVDIKSKRFEATVAFLKGQPDLEKKLKKFEKFLAMPKSEKRIGLYEGNGLSVSTVMIWDGLIGDFETAVAHENYNEGYWVIVEQYKTREDAEKGHEHWVKRLTEEELPDELTDVCMSAMTLLMDILDDAAPAHEKRKNWREMPNDYPDVIDQEG